MQPFEKVIAETLEKYKNIRMLVPNAINYKMLFPDTENQTIITYLPDGFVVGIATFDATIIYDQNAATQNPQEYYPEQILEHQKHHQAINQILETTYKIRDRTIANMKGLEAEKEYLPQEIINLKYTIKAAMTQPRYWVRGTTRNRTKNYFRSTIETTIIGYKLISEAFSTGEEFMKRKAEEITKPEWKEATKQIIQCQGEITTAYDRIILELGKELCVYEEHSKIIF